MCIVFTRRGHGCRKREYNCLHDRRRSLHLRPILIDEQQQQQQQQCHASSPSSTNSNGTMIHQLLINTNHTPTTTTSSMSSGTPTADCVPSVNTCKKNGILRSSTRQAAPLLPEAMV
jgi:hypothetical protein